MSNRSSSKQHCLVGNIRPRTSSARKVRKAIIRSNQAQVQLKRQDIWQQALAKLGSEF